MNQLDRWVISTLFATQGHHYRKRGRIYQQQEGSVHSLYSLNLSGETINDVNFVQFIQEELALHQIPPELICFEISETVAIAARKNFHLLRELRETVGFLKARALLLRTLSIDCVWLLKMRLKQK
ncbi:MAG: EAL domain-containing protein [Xenococcaceae cyanobacterium MO_188.B32]|nr:EAL domain-containing protein [Xenococcaceae cyanobacterium MO_188.B32]